MTELELLKDSAEKGWALAKSLQEQVHVLEGTVTYIATEPDLTEDDMVAAAQGCLRTLKLHRES